MQSLHLLLRWECSDRWHAKCCVPALTVVMRPPPSYMVPKASLSCSGRFCARVYVPFSTTITCQSARLIHVTEGIAQSHISQATPCDPSDFLSSRGRNGVPHAAARRHWHCFGSEHDYLGMLAPVHATRNTKTIPAIGQGVCECA